MLRFAHILLATCCVGLVIPLSGQAHRTPDSQPVYSFADPIWLVRNPQCASAVEAVSLSMGEPFWKTLTKQHRRLQSSVDNWRAQTRSLLPSFTEQITDNPDRWLTREDGHICTAFFVAANEPNWWRQIRETSFGGQLQREFKELQNDILKALKGPSEGKTPPLITLPPPHIPTVQTEEEQAHQPQRPNPYSLPPIGF